MERWTYFLHLVGWTAPIFAIQWIMVRPILRRNLREVLLASLISTVFFSVIDSFAVRAGIGSRASPRLARVRDRCEPRAR